MPEGQKDRVHEEIEQIRPEQRYPHPESDTRVEDRIFGEGQSAPETAQPDSTEEEEGA